MKINLDDKLIKELDSLFDNERNNQTEWDACIEDIVEEFIARQNGTWYEENYIAEDEEPDEVYFDLRNIGSSCNGKNCKLKHTITQPPFGKKDNLHNRINRK